MQNLKLVSVFFLVLIFSCSRVAFGNLVHPIYIHTPESNAKATVGSVKQDLRNGRIVKRLHITLDVLIRTACKQLVVSGHSSEAQEILDGWESQWSHYVSRITPRDLGDHAPLSKWLSVIYIVLDTLLTTTVMENLHLDDIHILNYAIPVVFSPCDPEWDKREYKLHFVPFAGVVTYWAVWAGCITLSQGATVSLCTTIGSTSECLMKTLPAGLLSNLTYNIFCD
jgi:hypothetical protein